MCTLLVPPGICLPRLPVEQAVLSQALARLLPFDPSRWQPGPAEALICPRCLWAVATYLLHWAAGPYWEVIRAGGLPGFSLFLHERTELAWYFENHRAAGLDPFVAADQIAGYEAAHFEA